MKHLKLKYRLKLDEALLGTTNSDPKVHDKFIASKAPDAPTREEEIAMFGVEEVQSKQTTIFPKLENGQPFLWDYQVKGFFKDAAGMLARVKDTASSKVKAYKKTIDGLVFVSPRKIPIELAGPITTCQRPLRASGPMGERTALASSEMIPAGSMLTFEVCLLDDKLSDLVEEWLDYGKLRGIGQWRNSGMGRFTVEELD